MTQGLHRHSGRRQGGLLWRQWGPDESFNLPEADGIAKLYIDGKLQGEFRRPQSFTWDPAKTSILLGLSYIGLMDDLALFRPALAAKEVMALHALPGGVASLSPKGATRGDP